MPDATVCSTADDARFRWLPMPARRARMAALPVASAMLVCFLATGCGGGDTATAPPAVAEPPIGAVGAVQEADGLAVSIDAVRTANAEVMVDIDPETEGVDTETLEPGEEFLILDVTIANESSELQEYIGLAWSATMPDGSERPASLLAMTGYDLAAGDLEPGEATSGEVVLRIPADITSLDVAYETRYFGDGSTLSWTIAIP